MRIAAGGALIALPGESLVWRGIRIVSGILLLAGLWTPVAGAVVALSQIGAVFFNAVNPWAQIMLGIIGAALALLGPGFWSVDARLFGWKRIELRNAGTHRS